MITNQDILDMAREVAFKKNLPQPKTREDVERLSGYVYSGPDPKAIGVTYTVPVKIHRAG